MHNKRDHSYDGLQQGKKLEWTKFKLSFAYVNLSSTKEHMTWKKDSMSLFLRFSLGKAYHLYLIYSMLVQTFNMFVHSCLSLCECKHFPHDVHLPQSRYSELLYINIGLMRTNIHGLFKRETLCNDW